MLKAIKTNSEEAVTLGKKTNGRVTALEDVVGPMNATYQTAHKFYSRCKYALGLVLASPFVTVFLERIAKHFGL